MTTNARQNMTNSIKNIVVPYLREHGFKGSFPTLEGKMKIILTSLLFNLIVMVDLL